MEFFKEDGSDECVTPDCLVHNRTDSLTYDNGDEPYMYGIAYVGPYAVYTDLAQRSVSTAMDNALRYLRGDYDDMQYDTVVYSVGEGSIHDGGYNVIASMHRLGAKNAHDFHVEAIDTLLLEGEGGIETLKAKWS